MIVKARLNDQELTISVGEGKQTIKWLAGAISAIINDKNSIYRRSIEDECCIITGITNTDHELLNPKDLILEHVEKDGSLTVNVQISSSYLSDEWGNPEMSVWQCAAYIHSSMGVKWATEIETWREKSREVQENGGLGYSKRPIDSNLVLIGEVYTEEDVHSAFLLDWNQMRWDSLNMKLTEALETQIRRSLLSNYGMICSLFSHYCGYGQVGERYGLTMQEFGHMLHTSNLMNLSQERDAIDSICEQFANSNKNVERVLLTRASFTMSLIALARSKQPAAFLNELERIFEKLTSLWKQLQSEYLMYSSPDDSIRISLREHFTLLKKVFESISQNDSKPGPVIFLPQLQRILDDTGILGSDQDSIVNGSFYHAQLSPSVDRELKQLVYIEFLEAICKAASLAINTSGLNDAKKARIMLNILTETLYSQPMKSNRK